MRAALEMLDSLVRSWTRRNGRTMLEREQELRLSVS